LASPTEQLNSGGGTVYIGVDDNGGLLGLKNAQADLLSVNNSLRNSVKPDIALFAHSRIEALEDKSIFVIDVQRGTNRPYYIDGKGMRQDRGVRSPRRGFCSGHR
jgi:ATP-dependent DNA helicase RecG